MDKTDCFIPPTHMLHGVTTNLLGSWGGAVLYNHAESTGLWDVDIFIYSIFPRIKHGSSLVPRPPPLKEWLGIHCLHMHLISQNSGNLGYCHNY